MNVVTLNTLAPTRLGLTLNLARHPADESEEATRVITRVSQHSDNVAWRRLSYLFDYSQSSKGNKNHI
jgi:hypothetical protein